MIQLPDILAKPGRKSACRVGFLIILVLLLRFVYVCVCVCVPASVRACVCDVCDCSMVCPKVLFTPFMRS